MDFSWYYIKGILALAGIYVLPVLGLSLLTGFTGLFSFGHAGFMAIGGYTSAFMMIKLHMPILPSLLMGGLVAALFSLIIGKFTLNLKGDYFCIATLGFGEAIRLILDNTAYFGGARGWPGVPSLNNSLFLVVSMDIIGIIILVNIIHSRHGRNMVAIREEELASQVIGINVFKYKMISLLISAFYAGVGGGLLGSYLTFLQPKIFTLTRSTELIIMVIFGGLGSISGSVLGALVLVSLPELLRDFARWRLVVYGVAVVFIMISRPQGLMGGKELSLKGLKVLFNKISSKRISMSKPLDKGGE
ncbi:MAG TPA: branched-chain amino acid ABC transporter permease [Clostridia bacterium]|nr:branched-chain amino acid ABC transporter permease [Clostridia bacterium]